MQQIKHQYSLTLIEHRVQQAVVPQRAVDGYINATALCAAAGKRWHNYIRNESSGKFVRTLSAKTGIAQENLIHEERVDGVPSTWVHPKIAIHLGQWLSADFAVQVSDWVYDWMDGGAGRGAKSATLPPHLARHMLNFGRIPPTHFSILQEMTTSLIAPLESMGYTLPEELVPDISQGKMFCKFLRTELGIDTDSLPTYRHSFVDGRVVPAKLYPVAVLGAFREFVNQTWLPERAAAYFRERDARALPFLDRLLQLTYNVSSANLPMRKKGPKVA